MKISLLILFVSAVLVSGCAASRDAAHLADITSAHVNGLNTELQAYVASANDSRKTDAVRLAATQQYFRSLEDESLAEVRAWRANPADARNKDKISAFESLQTDATADMSVTDSSLRQEGNVATALETRYGSVTYSPTQLQSIVADLQQLSQRANSKTQLQALYTFSSAVLQDAKNGLKAKDLNPNGLDTQPIHPASP